MNPVNVFFKPEKTVKEAIDKPNVGLAVGLIILPLVFLVVYAMILGLPIGMSILNMFAKDFVIWVVGIIVLYALLLIFKGKKIHGKFFGIFTATALIKLIQVLALTLGFIVLLLFGQPYLAVIKGIESGTMSYEKGVAQLESAEIELTSVFLIVSIITFAFMILLLFFGLYVLYQILEKTAHSTFIGNLIILFIYFIVMGIIIRLFG